LGKKNQTRDFLISKSLIIGYSTPFRRIIAAMISKKDETYRKLRYRIVTHELKPMEP
jgi:hypothetical protein